MGFFKDLFFQLRNFFLACRARAIGVEKSFKSERKSLSNKLPCLSKTRVKIAILGAGISGLTSAWYLKQRLGDAVSLKLYEKQNRVGGLIRTECIGDFLFEWGPRSLRAADSEEALSLIQELNLELLEADSLASKKYLYHQGKLEPFPTTIREFWDSPLTKGLLPALWRDLIAPRATLADESVHAFISRRFSAHIADQWIDPLVKGIYAGDPHQISMQSCFPALWKLEQKHRSLILGSLFGPKGKKGLLTLKGGLETLPRALAKSLEISLQTEVQKISWTHDKIHLHVENQVEPFDYLISTLPACNLAQLLPATPLASLLNQIPFKSVGVVHLGYAFPVNPYQGFGYLVPSKEKQEVLGVIFDSSAFPGHNRQPHETRLTVMLDRTDSPDELISLAQRNVKNHLGIEAPPTVAHAYVAHQAIPQYPVGFPSLLESIQLATPPGLFLLGTSFHGVSVNQCIKQAIELVGRMRQRLLSGKVLNPKCK